MVDDDGNDDDDDDDVGSDACGRGAASLEDVLEGGMTPEIRVFI